MKRIITEYISKHGIQFHHTITTFDSTEEKNSSEFLPETHYMCELFVLLSGSVTYNIEGQAFHFSAHDAVFILPNKLHSLEFDTSQPYERMVLHFPPNLLPSFSELNLFSSQLNYSAPIVIPKQTTEKHKIIDFMKALEQICQKEHKHMHLHIVSTILKIVEALDNVILNLNDSNALTPIKVDRISYVCIKYINENLLNKALLTPQNLSKELHISLSHLQHSFKKEMGVPLHRYITNQRMQLAKKLLTQGKPPQEVSNMLGFEYYSTFYHNFEKYFNASPTEYAKIEESLYHNMKVH